MAAESVRNLTEISPTIYFNVPAGYAALLPHLERDDNLARSFFAKLRLIFYAGAALPQDLWERLEAVSVRVTGARVLDLFAGSGAGGIEALSRGAASATFVEKDQGAAAVIDANLRATSLAGPAAGVTAPAFLRFGSWVGADRDGNPFVTAQVTRETATIQADHVLRALETATTRIGRALTLHAATTPPSAGLRRALAAAHAAHPELLAEIEARSPQEPYRTYLLFAAQRINATRVRHADLAYPGPAAFLADLRTVQQALADAGAAKQAHGELQNLVWQAETFGFHLAGLEVRQHSDVHARALAELRPAGPPGSEHSVGPSGAAPAAPLSAPTEEVLATFRAVAWVQDRYGVDACRRYVVSFTRSAADIAAVHELARYATAGGRPPVLDVVPLFESAADLANAPDVLTGMLALPEVDGDARHRADPLLGAQGPELRAKKTGKSINYWGLANIVNVNSAVLPAEMYDITLNCRYIWRAPFKVPDKQRKYGNLTLTYASQLHIAVVEVDRETFLQFSITLRSMTAAR